MLNTNDWAQITIIVTLLSSLLKPVLEQYVPGFKPTSPMHDNALRLVNLLFCVAGVLWVAATRNGLTATAIVPLLYYTAQQFVSSQGLYFISTRAGQSIASDAKITRALNAIGNLAGLKPGAPVAVATTDAPPAAQ